MGTKDTDNADTEDKRLPRNIVLCTDGTGNRGGVGAQTNVWRLFQALDRHKAPAGMEPQVAYYDDGVGTSAFSPARIAGLAFGWGLSKNIRDTYFYLVSHYRPGDRIHLAGFSRGAFTARCVAHLIGTCGVIAPGDTEEETKRRVVETFRAYKYAYRKRLGRAENYPLPLQEDAVFKRANIDYCSDWRVKTGEGPDHSRVPIASVGVWDTVGAVAMPIAELRTVLARSLDLLAKIPGLAKFIPVVEHLDGVPSPNIERGFHALAIDDRRYSFHPLLWDKSRDSEFDQRFEQVWFCGMHADVGGGYPKQNLSQVSMQWMVKRLKTCKVAFERQRLNEITMAADVLGTMHDSRSGFGMYYRYNPRDIPAFWERANRRARQAEPLKIHHSVIERIKDGTDGYAPYNLPAEFEVVPASGKAVSWPGAAAKFGAEPERAEPAGRLMNSAAGPGRLICKRRYLYLIFIATSMALLSALWLVNPVPAGYTSFELLQTGPLSGVAALRETLGDLFEMMLPDTVKGKFDVLADFPIVFWPFVALFAGLWLWHNNLKGQVDGLAQRIWGYLFRGQSEPTEQAHGEACRWSRDCYTKSFMIPVFVLFGVSAFCTARWINERQDALYFGIEPPECAASANPDGSDSVLFDTRCQVFSTGRRSDDQRTYRVSIQAPEDGRPIRWFDRCIPASPHGLGRVSNKFSKVIKNHCPGLKKIPKHEMEQISRADRAAYYEDRWLFRLLRCRLPAPDAPWFVLLAQVGNGSPVPLEEGKAEIEVTGSGELKLFVNDVSGFYGNNLGQARLTIAQVEPAGTSQSQ